MKKCLSWADFKEHLTKLDDVRNYLMHSDVEIDKRCKGEVYYRGQANAKWGLVTTLKRENNISESEKSESEKSKSEVSKPEIEPYFQLLKDIHPIMKTCGLENVPDLPSNWVIDDEQVKGLLSFMRHLGFRSPLLDWTLSQIGRAHV